MKATPLRIPVPHAGLEHVSALLDEPAEDPGGTVVLLAHGAGVGMGSEFLGAVARGLADGGLPVLRFHYPYAERMEREGRRRPPDRRPVLESTHRAVLEQLVLRYPARPVLLAGKSMGSRIGSHLAAEGADVRGLVHYGYPLHPAGRPERLRTEHLPAIAQPSLFLQGTRDALCDLDLLRSALETHGGTVTLETIEDADHDFGVPRRTGRTREEVLAELVRHTLDWIVRTWPA